MVKPPSLDFCIVMYLAVVIYIHLNYAQLVTLPAVPVSPVVSIFVANDGLLVASVTVSMLNS